ncbi:endocuticle structural glycoprotein ABD-4-like [Danaus plexippus]|uniref:endocuticle structural glycoprotein ABD-4-like n=1 Tax=Danaus plexippus TaxID=13037 RepID=UPI002AB0AFEB|nr:endocuticle structural glycoprotein ABD-4-like [Danaus plexippus]
MNKFVLSFIFPALMALASAAPSVGPIQGRAAELAATRALPALDYEEVRDEFGQFALRYITAEGIVVSERGRLVPNLKGDGYVLITEGEISYISDDGKTYVTKFTAGIDGNHMEGNHLPTTPKPISEAPALSPEQPESVPITPEILRRVG